MLCMRYMKSEQFSVKVCILVRYLTKVGKVGTLYNISVSGKVSYCKVPKVVEGSKVRST